MAQYWLPFERTTVKQSMLATSSCRSNKTTMNVAGSPFGR